MRIYNHEDPYGEESWEDPNIKNNYERRFKDITGYDFQRYYLEYRPKLARYLLARFKDVDKAEDFTNQAFMQALEKIETYDKEKSKLITWLTKIAINLVIKEWKDNHKYNFISLERDTVEAPSILNILRGDDDGVDTRQEIENRRKCEIVYDVINNLQDKYKKVMIMRELNHMAYKDIADTIKKETKIEVNEEKIVLENPEDFYSLNVKNLGEDEIKIHFVGQDGEYIKTISPNDDITISREDINWERSINDTFNIDSTSSKIIGTYTTTTNLSTIKSQIKKGRELIYKKAHRKLKHINDNGVEKFNF